MNVLLGVSGSVAATLTPKLQRVIGCKYGFKTVLTESTKHFVKATTMDNIWWAYYTDSDEWDRYEYDQTVLHIDLTKWADVFLIAPCTANTLAKMANGMCDNLLTSCVRAWDYKKPMIVAPAMNTNMLNSEFYQEHINRMVKLGASIVPPITKTLYCGDHGDGAMAQIEDIMKMVDMCQSVS